MAAALAERVAGEVAKKGSGPTGAQRYRSKKARQALVDALPPGDESELEAMRWVISNSQDRTYQHWSMRQWLKEDAKEFRAKFAGLVRAERLAGRSESRGTLAPSSAAPSATPLSGMSGSTSPSSPGPSAAPCGDEGMERLGELLSQELTEWEEYRSWKSSRNTANTAGG